MIEQLVMRQTDPFCWALYPYLVERMCRFCSVFDTEMQPIEVVTVVRDWFTRGDPRLGLWVLVQDRAKIVGHLWATPEPFGADHPRYTFIRQAWMDSGVEALDACQGVFDSAKEWTASQGLTKMKMLTHRNPQVMARKWGFKTVRTLMEVSVGPRLVAPPVYDSVIAGRTSHG